VQFHQIQVNLRGHISELLAKVTQQGELDKELSQIDREKFLEMLSNFGALKRRPNGKFVYSIPSADLSASYSNAGYRVEPGAYLDCWHAERGRRGSLVVWNTFDLLDPGRCFRIAGGAVIAARGERAA